MSKDIYIPNVYGDYALLSCVWAQIHIWMLFYSFDVFDVQTHLKKCPPPFLIGKKIVKCFGFGRPFVRRQYYAIYIYLCVSSQPPLQALNI